MISSCADNEGEEHHAHALADFISMEYQGGSEPAFYLIDNKMSTSVNEVNDIKQYLDDFGYNLNVLTANAEAAENNNYDCLPALLEINDDQRVAFIGIYGETIHDVNVSQIIDDERLFAKILVCTLAFINELPPQLDIDTGSWHFTNEGDEKIDAEQGQYFLFISRYLSSCDSASIFNKLPMSANISIILQGDYSEADIEQLRYNFQMYFPHIVIDEKQGYLTGLSRLLMAYQGPVLAKFNNDIVTIYAGGRLCEELSYLSQ
jgi:hypothetical protein